MWLGLLPLGSMEPLFPALTFGPAAAAAAHFAAGGTAAGAYGSSQVVKDLLGGLLHYVAGGWRLRACLPGQRQRQMQTQQQMHN
jgi:hypothetical protein